MQNLPICLGEAIIEMREAENGGESSESDAEGGEEVGAPHLYTRLPAPGVPAPAPAPLTSRSQVEEAESVTSNKFLLLVDQLSVDQKHHLSIKDIGIILDRLSSKILDVEKLDREKEDNEVYNWTIKATIRGEVMRELGVIYNSNYYSISEHPCYLKELPESPSSEGPATKEERR